jgi:resuscitation-promoting factor RpfB
VDIPPRSRFRSGSSLRKQPGSPVNPLLVLIVLVIGFGVVIIGGFYSLSAPTVTVVINGTQNAIRSHQQTVSGLLAEVQVLVEPQDIVSPPAETPIRNGLVVTITKAHPVTVEVDGQQRRVLTQLIQPREILGEAGITVGPHDLIRVDNADLKSEPYAAPPFQILIVRALPVQLDDNGTKTTIFTISRTVGEVLDEANTPLYLGDAIDPDPAAPITENTVITVRRSIPLTIQVDGRMFVTRTHGRTVGEALAESGIALIGLDYASPPDATPLQADMTIRVVRVTEEDTVIQQTPIDFKRVTKADPTLPLDTRQVIQQGVAGVIEQRIHVRREDGVEVSRSPVETVVAQAPRDEITAIGTKATLKTLDTPDGPIQYWRVLDMRAASYRPSSAGRSRDDPQYGMTATGQKLRKGLVAVDPTVIPLGTKLYIPGYGIAIAADTGGAVQGLVIDLGYGDDDYQEWSGTVKVYLLPPIPSPDQIPIVPEETK